MAKDVRLIVRVTEEEECEVLEQIMIHNGRSHSPTWDMSDFLRGAIQCYLSHLRRGCAASEKRRKGPWVALDVSVSEEPPGAIQDGARSSKGEGRNRGKA